MLSPTVIAGETGTIEPASEFIPESDYVLHWDYPNIDDQGNVKADPIILELSWDDGQTVEELEIKVVSQRGLTEDVYIDENGISTSEVEVGRKTKFYLKSSLTEQIEVKQISGEPVPAADETGAPTVSSFVVSIDVDVLVSEDGIVFQPIELAGYAVLLVTMIIVTKPSEKSLAPLQKLYGKDKHVRIGSIVLAIITLALGGITVSSTLAVIGWLLAGIMVNRTTEGNAKAGTTGRTLKEVDRLKHSISNTRWFTDVG